MEDPSFQFPLHVQADGDDYIIEKENELSSPTSPNYFTSPDEANERTRLKRRRRCGQCGPCQIKENCNKCHYCIRKDVLKQTCIYRKCVYLRSKPKPYSRPREHAQIPRPSVPPSETPPQACQGSTSRPLSCNSDSSQISSPIQKDETASCLNPFLPPEIQEHPPYSMPVGPPSHPDHSTVHPALSPALPIHQPIATNHQTSVSSVHQPVPSAKHSFDPGKQHISSPPSVNFNSRTPPVSHGLSHVPPQQMSRPQHQMMMPPPPPNMLTDRMFPDIRNQPSMGMPSHMFQHQHPMSFPHISQRFGDGPYPGYNKTPTMTDIRPPVPSQCMYPPNFHSPMQNFMERPHFQSNMERPPNGPSYFPTNSEMFRQYASLSQGYPFPSGGGYLPQNFTGPHLPGFGGMGIQPPPGFPPLPTQGNHTQALNFPPQSHPSCEQSVGCPKNGYCPPASLNTDTDSRVMQERYGSIRRSSMVSGFHPIPWGSDYFRPNRRPASAFSDDASRMSVTSSDFECDVISIDDFRMNAFIRSDGCNSIEIEIDDRLSESGQLSSSSSSSSTNSPESLQSDKSPTKSVNSDSGCESPKKCPEKVKVTVKGFVCLKQDLGDEGIIQLEIPGEKVTIEESHLDENLARYSCDLKDLLEFIQKEPKVEYIESSQRLN